MIELQAVEKSYKMGTQTLHVLKGVSLAINQGDYVAIVGPSGSGKSTLMHILGCLDIPAPGRYVLAGQDVSKLKEARLAPIRRQHIGFVFQSFNLLGTLNAQENVALPLLYQGVNGRRQRERAKDALSLVGLGDRLHHRPNQLSGGQQQRVAIARAIVADPPVILADEPTGNLDSQSGQDLLQIFSGLNQAGRTLVVITHDAEVARHAKRVIEIRDGRIVGDREVSHA
ncbi:MAG: ABC transporter ATP-binding protein [Thermaerobacter sp.]|nr:ABC transporter ATP-binding protein [Thermaerobacter sp.]